MYAIRSYYERVEGRDERRVVGDVPDGRRRQVRLCPRERLAYAIGLFSVSARIFAKLPAEVVSYNFV